MTFIEMPKLSDTMTEGTLVKWLKNEGDNVEIGDVIAEVETDKATMEMEAFDEGKLGKIYVAEGGKAAINQKIAVLLEDGEEAPEAPEAPPEGGAAPAPEAAAEDPAASSGPIDAPAPAAAAATAVAPEGSERIKASPLARKIAAEKGVSLIGLAGTGAGGRIVKADVLSAAGGNGVVAGGAAPAISPMARPVAGGADQKIPLSGMRTIIAQRLLESKTQIPHFYLNIEVDAAPMMGLRKQLNASQGEDGNKFTVNDFVLKAVIGASVAVPQVNASFAGDHIIQYGSVNLAVAVAVDDGLVTPTIRDAQSKSLLEISLAVKDLATRARNKKLAPDEFQGGTITVSNLGAYGVDSFDAIINPPQSAILSISSIRNVPVVNDDGDIVPGLRMGVGMSCDHRVVDGAVGATYLAEFKKLIESPALMLF
ncbi:MAG: pyruvate dehydrogenase complex dihydrolipoamide acetyltransferase [Verrucomicrobiota bacterium]